MEERTSYMVLVLEDDQALQHVFQQVLKRANFEVSLASSAQPARELLGRKSFDLMLCDLSAGGARPMEFIAGVRSEQAGMPVLIVTGYATPELSIQASKIGAHVLEKPFDPKELVYKVKALIAESKASAA